MFLPVNIRKKIIDSHLTFIVDGIFGGSHPGLFPLNGHSFRCAWGTPVGELFPVKLRAVCLLLWWRWAPSRGFFKYFFYHYYYHYNGYFGVTNPGGCLVILNTLFILILQGRKLFWRAPFAVGILINNWYYVSCLLNITSALEL